MRRIVSLLIALLAVIGPSSLGAADKSSPNFDQGLDVPRILKSIKQKAAGKNAAAPTIPVNDAVSWAILPTFQAAAPVDPRDAMALQMFGTIGALHNRLFNYLSNHENHVRMQNLLADPRMDRVSVEIREALRAEGIGLTQQRNDMLPEANRLDATDTGLADEKIKIEASKRALDDRLAEINRRKSEHDGLCLPTHPPERHQWCVDNANRLNRIIGVYNNDVKKHNEWVADWRKRVDVLNPQWDSFVGKIRAWENLIKGLIEKIEREFQRLQECTFLNGTSEIIHIDPLQSKVTCNYNCCGRPASHPHFISGAPAQDQVNFICTNPLPRCSVGDGKASCEGDAIKGAGDVVPVISPLILKDSN